MNRNVLWALGLLMSTTFATTDDPKIQKEDHSSNKETVSSENRGWGLIFEDEFEGTELNSNNWTHEQGGSSAWNNTAVDDPRVIVVSDGTLKLKAIKNPNYSGSIAGITNIDKNTIWTGACDTRKKVDFKYGKVEVRARMESVPHAWPAIWLMPTDSKYGGNPNSGEIDMVERLNLDDYFYSTIHTEYHWDAPNGKQDPERYTTKKCTDLDDWATYTLEWDENKIDFFRNGEMYHTFNKGASAQKDGYLRWPFDEDFYIILSQQIGGGWVSGEAQSKGLSLKESDLPYELEIDYVRVYQAGINNVITSNAVPHETKFAIQYTKSGNVKLSKATEWTVYDVAGKILKQGVGDFIPFTNHTSGCFFVETKFGTVKLSIL